MPVSLAGRWHLQGGVTFFLIYLKVMVWEIIPRRVEVRPPASNPSVLTLGKLFCFFEPYLVHL